MKGAMNKSSRQAQARSKSIDHQIEEERERREKEIQLLILGESWRNFLKFVATWCNQLEICETVTFRHVKHHSTVPSVCLGCKKNNTVWIMQACSCNLQDTCRRHLYTTCLRWNEIRYLFMEIVLHVFKIFIKMYNFLQYLYNRSLFSW